MSKNTKTILGGDTGTDNLKHRRRNRMNTGESDKVKEETGGVRWSSTGEGNKQKNTRNRGSGKLKTREGEKG